MNEPIAPTPKPKRTRKASTPRAPRVKDPGIAQIEMEAADKKAQYRKAQQSSGILKRISEKYLPRLTTEDANKLADELKGVATPLLLPKEIESDEASEAACS